MDAPFPPRMVEEIAVFLAADQEPAGKDLYPKVFETAHFFPLQRQQELAAMMRLARATRPRVIMEIGADKGGGLYHWSKCLPTVELAIGYEIRGTPYSHLFERHLSPQFFWGEDSQNVRRYVQLEYALGGASIDVLFIDGDKLMMEQDFDRYRPLMNPDGLVFFHDVQDREPRASYWAVRDRGYGGQVVVNLEDTHAALARMDEGLEPASPHEWWLRHWRGRSCGVGVVYLGSKDPA